jgi:hypothetical protein
MQKSLINILFGFAAINLWLISCSKDTHIDKSYGELSEHRAERVYLLLAFQIFPTYGPYMNAQNKERESEAFIVMESTLQLNLARIKYVMKNEVLSEETRYILDHTLKTCDKLFKKHPPVYHVWNTKGKVYDLGKEEPILPRFCAVYDILNDN